MQGFGNANRRGFVENASIVGYIENEIKPILLRLTYYVFEHIYNGTRDHYALSRGRKFRFWENVG
jgi:hypothetical protein